MSQLPSSRSGRSALEIATQAVTQAGEILLSRFHSKKEVKSKGRSNLVTDADIISEKTIVEFIGKEYPFYGIISEEGGNITADSEYTWIVDPLDGTNNYIFGIPFFSITLALTQGDEIVFGIIYDPLRGELFWARQGEGAYLNDSAISISEKTSLETSLVGFDLGYDAQRGGETLKIILKLWPEVHSLRIIGSAALGLAYTACGRVDLYFHRLLYPWDLASGILLVNESGGKVTDWEGQKANVCSTEVVATNESLHRQFLKLV